MRALLPDILKGATFDDFLIKPHCGVVMRRHDVDLSMSLIGRIMLGTPIVSANMDTVTGSRMARAMALEGGLGFIHRACSIDMQSAWVKEVKEQHAYIVNNPVTLPPTATLAMALEIIRQKKSSSILIVDEKNKLLAILCNRDIPWHKIDEYLDKPVYQFATLMSENKMVCAKPGISLEKAAQLLYVHRIEKLPVIDDEGVVRGLITKRDLELYREKSRASIDGEGRLRVGAAIGATGDYMERAEALIASGVDMILMDVAHAHSFVVQGALKQFRGHFGDFRLVAGNIGTLQGAKFLVEHGADAVKVGIGPGRGCRTRLETGIGVPQLQAIWEVSNIGVPVIADGGMKHDKDIAFAILCGASTVMLGSMLAGTDESPGIAIRNPATGQKEKRYRGMTSPDAVVDASQAGDEDGALATPAEGQSANVPYIGGVVDVIARIRGHLASMVSYIGQKRLCNAREAVAREPEEYLTRLSEASRRESFER